MRATASVAEFLKSVDDPVNLGQKIYYGRVRGEFAYNGIGAGIDLVISQYGPVLGRVTVPLAIPLGQTGLILSRVEGGFTFGLDALRSVDDPMQLLNDPAFDDPLDVSNERIRQAVVDAVSQQQFTWEKSVTLNVKGTIRRPPRRAF